VRAFPSPSTESHPDHGLALTADNLTRARAPEGGLASAIAAAGAHEGAPRHQADLQGTDADDRLKGTGGFDAAAELVIVTGDMAPGRANDANWAAQAIGDANQAYTVGQTTVFAVDDGSTSAIYRFQSAGDDATVSGAELTLLAVLNGTASTAPADYVFAA